VGNDVNPLRERNGRNIARNRQIWQNFLRKIKAQKRAVLTMMMIKGTKGVTGPVGYGNSTRTLKKLNSMA
jgi:hypothetical protein